jgi:hypothetical protein
VKSPGYDLITGKILKELPTSGIHHLTQLFNAVLLKGFFLAQWKVAQTILIPKPEKSNQSEPTEYNSGELHRTPPVKDSAHYNRRTTACAEYGNRKYLKIPTVKHEISRYSYHYSKRLSVHPNELILNLQEPPETRRLRKNLPIDLLTRFNM